MTLGVAILLALAGPLRGDGLIAKPARIWEHVPGGGSHTFVFHLTAEQGDVRRWKPAIESFVIDRNGNPSRMPRGPAAAPFAIAGLDLDARSGTVSVSFDVPSGDAASYWAALVLTGPPVRQEWDDGAVTVEPVLVLPLVVITSEENAAPLVERVAAVRSGETVDIVAEIRAGATPVRITPTVALEQHATDLPMECAAIEGSPLTLLPHGARQFRISLQDAGCADRVLLILPGGASLLAPVVTSSPAV